MAVVAVALPTPLMADVIPKVRRRRWGLKDMEVAMEAVEKGTTVSKASRKFNVPRKTLDDRVKGRVEHGSNPGPNTALTAEKEKALVAYLFYMAERGFPLTVNMARAFAWAVSFRSGSNSRFNEDTGPGKHWWRNFRARHPELTLRTSEGGGWKYLHIIQERYNIINIYNESTEVQTLGTI